MRFDRIRLRHFKCYDDADVRLNPGVTVIHGLNGSGKSSLLEACFFALYGAKALDRTLDEIVTIGAEEASVELWFRHDGAAYHIEREIVVRDDSARTKTCVLEGPDDPVEGATDVRQRVTNLLRMDTDAFVNCAYVRQGEVNKLINASPSDRQDMLDDLLQLGKLEEYRERASRARVGVGRVRDDKKGALAEIDEQIAEKEEKNLHERRNELRTTLGETSEEIERFEENRDEAEQTLEEAAAVLDEYEDKQEELSQLAAETSELRNRIEETERVREEMTEEIQEKRTRLAEKRDHRDQLLEQIPETFAESPPSAETVRETITAVRDDMEDVTERIRELSVEKQDYDGKADSLTEAADEHEQTATEKREQADELADELAETRELLDRKREELSEIAADIETKRDELADSPAEFGSTTAYREDVAATLNEVREERTEKETELENARERLEEARELREAGKCPACGQPVDESPHVDAIDQREETVEALEAAVDAAREREEELEDDLSEAKSLVELEQEIETLQSERESLEQLLDERERACEEKESRIEQLRTEAESETETAAEKREQARDVHEQASECQEKIATQNREKQELRERVETLDELAAATEAIGDIEADIESLQEQRTDKESVNDERRERLEDLRERQAELEESFDSDQFETAREQKATAESYLEDVGETLDALESKRSELEGKIGAVENEIEALETLRDRREEVEATVERLTSLYEETANLEEMYGQLRSELRQRNVESLERMLNETFELVYENDTYSRLELDGEYRLTVYQKDGETLEPDQLSGGERALFNLSLRCAIYRLLAEGIEGTAPMPPLILDEPTVFLDAGHVGQLVELVDAMRDLGVEQILVVSHDEELVAGADELITVRKDPTTNRSTVERAESVDERLLAEAGD